MGLNKPELMGHSAIASAARHMSFITSRWHRPYYPADVAIEFSLANGVQAIGHATKD